MAHRVDVPCLCLPVAIRWHDDSLCMLLKANWVFLVHEHQRNELVLRDFTTELFPRHANSGAITKESQLENEGFMHGTIYIGT